MNKWFVSFLFIIGTLMSLSATPTVQIAPKSGQCTIEHVRYPAVGFGTYPLTGETCTKAVNEAIEAGYRIIDTATFYHNLSDIAKALKGHDRKSLYLISKVWHDHHTPEGLQQDLDETLAQLQTNYLDAYFLHWPNKQIPIEQTLAKLQEFVKAKTIRHIGLSNVSVNHLRRALEVGIPITWVQIEMHPFFYNAEVLAFCQKHHIAVQAWAPLARGRIIGDPLLNELAKKYHKTSSQIAIRWIIQHGCLPLPGSKSPKHIQDNIQVNDFILTANEMAEIDQRAVLGQRERYQADLLGIDDEFDLSYEECWPKK